MASMNTLENLAPVSDDDVRGSFRVFPTLSADTVRMVGFDEKAKPCISLEIEATEDLESWGMWMIRWLRRRALRKKAKPPIRLL